jgi:hypothetical protein
MVTFSHLCSKRSFEHLPPNNKLCAKLMIGNQLFSTVPQERLRRIPKYGLFFFFHSSRKSLESTSF